MVNEAANTVSTAAAVPLLEGNADLQAASRRVDSDPHHKNIAACRNGASWFRQLLLLAVLCWLATILLRVAGGLQPWIWRRAEVFMALGGIAVWRWSWFLIQNIRAMIYRYYSFPRLRRQAEAVQAQYGPVPEVTVLATTYHEKPWITAPVFDSIFTELSKVKGLVRRPKVVVVTGCDEDDRNVQALVCPVLHAPGSWDLSGSVAA